MQIQSMPPMIFLIMTNEIVITGGPTTKPPEVRLIQKKKHWCPVNQCECLFEKCIACKIFEGILYDKDNPNCPIILNYPKQEKNEKSSIKVWYCEHYKKEIKRIEL